MFESKEEEFKVIVYTKYLKNTFGVFVHNYIAIPELELEIHPGRFFFGTHHDFGTFKKRSEPVKTMTFCKSCLKHLLQKAQNLDDTWYYPIVNCEALTRGLTQHVPISFQTILITGIFTTFILGIQHNILFIVSFLFLVLLLFYNNSCYKWLGDSCVHYGRSK